VQSLVYLTSEHRLRLIQFTMFGNIVKQTNVSRTKVVMRMSQRLETLRHHRQRSYVELFWLPDQFFNHVAVNVR